MRGEVLKPEDADGPGLILGQDGTRYHFTTARVHKGAALAAGAAVDFIALGEDARDIYPLAPSRPEPRVNPPAPVYAPAAPPKADGLITYFLRALSRDYFRFNGRARRAEYWSYALCFWLTLLFLFIADTFISEAVFGTGNIDDPDFTPILSVFFYIYNIIPSAAITVRRLHDRGLSGWLYLLNVFNFFFYIGGLILFIFMVMDSRRETNKHGPSPKYGGLNTADTFN